MAIFRLPKKRKYVSISNDLARDPSLSLEARGLMLYLLSHNEEFKVTAETVEANAGIGRDKRRRIYGELERAGYFTVHRDRNEKGQVSFRIDVHEEPVPDTERTSDLRQISEKAGSPLEPSDESPDSQEDQPAENPTVGDTNCRESEPRILENHEVQNPIVLENHVGESKPTPPAVPKNKTQSQIPVHPEQTFRLDSVVNHLASIYQLPFTNPFHGRAYFDAAETVCRLVRAGGEIEALTIYFDSIDKIPELKFLAQKFSQWAANEKRKQVA